MPCLYKFCLFFIPGLLIASTHVSAQMMSASKLADGLSGAATLIEQKDTSNSALINDLRVQVHKLSDHLLDNSDKIDTVYLKLLNRYYIILDSIAHTDMRDPKNLMVLQDVLADFRLKNATPGAWQIAETNFKYTTPVEVVTRQLLANGQFQTVNGYRIYANPWVDRNKKPAKINFQNSTNPGSADDIPPGRYYIWATSISGKEKEYPVRIDFTDIPYAAGGKQQTIFIDITQ
jgi:hypothetical protein